MTELLVLVHEKKSFIRLYITLVRNYNLETYLLVLPLEANPTGERVDCSCLKVPLNPAFRNVCDRIENTSGHLCLFFFEKVICKSLQMAGLDKRGGAF